MITIFFLIIFLVTVHAVLLLVKIFRPRAVKTQVSQPDAVYNDLGVELTFEERNEQIDASWTKTAYAVTILFVLCTLPHFASVYLLHTSDPVLVILASSKSILSPIAVIRTHSEVRAFWQKLMCRKH